MNNEFAKLNEIKHLPPTELDAELGKLLTQRHADRRKAHAKAKSKASRAKDK